MPKQLTHTEALVDIALLLGEAEEWSSPADFLEEIADTIKQAGLPHPGNTSPNEYRDLMMGRLLA